MVHLEVSVFGRITFAAVLGQWMTSISWSVRANIHLCTYELFCLFGWLVGLVWFVYSTILCLCRNGYSDWLRVVMGVDSNSMHTFMHVPSQPFGTLEGIVSAVDVKQLNSISTY